MPGTGKSTVGVLLAKSLLMDFVDTDLLIQKEYSCSLCDIIEKDGIDSFIETENRIIAKTLCLVLRKRKNSTLKPIVNRGNVYCKDTPMLVGIYR